MIEAKPRERMNMLKFMKNKKEGPHAPTENVNFQQRFTDKSAALLVDRNRELIVDNSLCRHNANQLGAEDNFLKANPVGEHCDSQILWFSNTSPAERKMTHMFEENESCV